MKFDDLQCEVCGASEFKVLGMKSYKREQTSRLDPYNAKRFRVLFEKWFPGKDEIELKSILCVKCGLVCYQPRPEKADINAKYRFLEELGQDYGKLPYDAPLEQKRSEVLHQSISARLDLSLVAEVLDYGGGDGRLMQAFIKRGKICFNVDYNTNCIPGVTKISDTLDGLDKGRKFGLIVCSHVIEHVAEPLSVIRELSGHLKVDGWLYVEVPMEIWKRAPLQQEPVTHINFFTQNSLYNLLKIAGLDVKESRLTSYLHPSGNFLHGIKSISCRGKQDAAQDGFSTPEAEEWMQPKLTTYVRYIATNPHVLMYAVKRRLG